MDITLEPRLWEGVPADAEGLVDRWLVSPGDRVDADQVLARVIVAKSTLDVVAPASGVLARVDVPAGANFARGDAIGTLQAD